MKRPAIMVMGVGNVLLSDEGLGVHFLKELEKEDLPENVELLEGGTAGMELAHLIKETDFLIIIDALNANVQPGALFRFRPGDIKVIPDTFEVSFHQVGIIEVLTTANLLGDAPQTIIYGVQPKNLDWGLDMSEEIKAALPRVKEHVLKEITNINNTNQFIP